MRELINRLGLKVIAQAGIVWLLSLLLAMMALDCGFILGFYLVASLLYWGGSLIYFKSRRSFTSGDLWAFRLGPFILLVLGLAGATVLTMLGKQ
jgi:hypothetical protein